MVDIKKVRELVKTLSNITDAEWEKMEKIFSKTIKVELKSETKTKRKIEDLSLEEKEKIVSELLKKVGVPSSIKGYHYIREAIIFEMDNMIYRENITKILYPAVAKKFNSSSSKVERAIRHAIEVAWERGNTDMQIVIFGSSRRPTNAEAVSGFVEYLRFNVNI